jgi:hypothetical protein
LKKNIASDFHRSVAGVNAIIEVSIAELGMMVHVCNLSTWEMEA